MAHAHIVFAHPAAAGFTREVLRAVAGRLTALGCTISVSDLYDVERTLADVLR